MTSNAPMARDAQPARTVRKTTATIIAFFMLLGFALIVFSVALPATQAFRKELSKELGIVLLAVCSVSMIYELFVAEKHFSAFLASLQSTVERGETNAAVCERLGIIRIFPTRDQCEAEYPLERIAAALNPSAPFLMVAKSLFLTMTRRQALKDAVSKGAAVRLCCIDPQRDSPLTTAMAGPPKPDTIAALGRFRTLIADLHASEGSKPAGSIEVRYQNHDLPDSYFAFAVDGRALAVWDVTFGPDHRDKQIFLLDSSKGLGQNLCRRYEWIWSNATPKFKYEFGKVSLDELPSDH